MEFSQPLSVIESINGIYESVENAEMARFSTVSIVLDSH
jgi:hypothetical protein